MKPWQLLLILSVAIRLALVVYSEIYDSQAAATDVQYTDVDYRVAVEAGQLMWPVAANSTSDLVRVASRNPFSRHTFRYTPLLALLASIDTIVGPGSLKVVYCAVDAVVGYLLLVSFAVPWPLVAAGYLLNPIVIGVTSRGNAEAITVLSVLLLLRASMPRTRQPMVMGILLAWAIHWRLYPVIFAPALLMVLFCAADPGAEQGRQVQHDSGIFALLRSWQHWRVVLGPLFDFALGLLAALSALTLLGYWWCGWIYIEQAYLYHFTRTDVRHNFSAWFYPLYVTMPAGVSPWWNMLLTASQLPVHLALAWRYGQRGTDLPLCFCLQTLVFVAFNKVFTSQYFVWYLGLLPLVWQQGFRASILPFAAWLAAQALWLSAAYGLEFEGRPLHAAVWLCSCLVFVAHVCIISSLITPRVR